MSPSQAPNEFAVTQPASKPSGGEGSQRQNACCCFEWYSASPAAFSFETDGYEYAMQAFSPLANTYGAVWETNRLPTAPLDLQYTDASGLTHIAR